MTYFDILRFLNKFFVFFYKSAPCFLEVRAFALRLAAGASGCASWFFKLRGGT